MKDLGLVGCHEAILHKNNRRACGSGFRGLW